MANKLISRITLFVLSLIFALPDVTARSNEIFPVVRAYSGDVYTVLADKLADEEQIMAYSLQGLINRDTAKIFIKPKTLQTVFDLYRQQGYINSEKEITNPFELVKKYANRFKGVVVYDPEKDYTVNLAANIAGVEDRLIVTEKLLDKVRTILGSTVDVKDIRAMKFAGKEEAHKWYMDNIFPRQRHDVLGVGNSLPRYTPNIDYYIAFRVPVFWLPGPKDADYSPEYEKQILELMEKTLPNTPVLGFWPGRDRNNQRIGYDEYAGVKLAGYYGKYTIVSTHSGNYSFHSAFESGYEYKQAKVRSAAVPKYDSSKKYVALIMIESGDAPGYMHRWFIPYQWGEEHRESVPVSYGITPSMLYLLPAFLKYYYETASENNYFFNSISGAGYCYPFEGYGSRTADPAATFREYCRITAANMKTMDIDMLGLYTHPKKMFDDDDKRVADTIIRYTPGLTSLILGMHIVPGFSAANGNWMASDNVSAHHTLTRWSLDPFKRNDTSIDRDAADFIAREIRNAAVDGNFIQAMFYSWQYGPRRLRILQEILEAEGYLFVTLDKFDLLYRKSLN